MKRALLIVIVVLFALPALAEENEGLALYDRLDPEQRSAFLLGAKVGFAAMRGLVQLYEQENTIESILHYAAEISILSSRPLDEVAERFRAELEHLVDISSVEALVYAYLNTLIGLDEDTR